MIDVKKDIYNTLKTILPTYYELYVDSSTETPCITYLESNNSADAEGNTLAYSELTFIIKIWADDLGVIGEKSVELDRKMRELGFRRTNTNELWYRNHCQRIFTYKALGKEYL